MKLRARGFFLVGFAFCAILLLSAGYFQFVQDLEPCPLCISQRVAVLLVSIILLSALIHNPKTRGTQVYALLVFLTATLGAAIAGRHVWLQNLPPDEVPSCGPGLEYIFNNFPINETIKLLLNGTGECAEILFPAACSLFSGSLLKFICVPKLTKRQDCQEDKSDQGPTRDAQSQEGP